MNRVGNVANNCEQTKFRQEEAETQLKEVYQEWVKKEEKNRYDIRELEEEMESTRKWVGKLQEKENEKICMESRILEHKLEKFKEEYKQQVENIV